MRRTVAQIGLLAGLFLGNLIAGSATAGSLQVSTTTIDVAAPGSASFLQLRNTGTQPINVQTRIFRWTQTFGEERLIPSKEVAVSPPFANIPPGQDFTVRVVRGRGTPVANEEAYRLLVDEIPATPGRSVGVNFTVRHSIPVFFGGAQSGPLSWQLTSNAQGILLTATNHGTRRVRLAGLKIKENEETIIAERDGLVGYILGGSSISWTLPVKIVSPLKGTASIQADSDSGPIHAQIPLSPPN